MFWLLIGIGKFAFSYFLEVPFFEASQGLEDSHWFFCTDSLLSY